MAVFHHIYFEKKFKRIYINMKIILIYIYTLLLLENISLEQLTIISSLITALKGHHNNCELELHQSNTIII